LAYAPRRIEQIENFKALLERKKSSDYLNLKKNFANDPKSYIKQFDDANSKVLEQQSDAIEQLVKSQRNINMQIE